MSEVKLKISAQESASKVLADVRESMTRLEEVSTKVGSALGLIGVAGIGGLVATVRAAVDGVDAFNDLSDATGSSIENISALDDLAARTGTSFGTVETALIKFNNVLKDAKPGSDAEAVFTALGLSVAELKELDPSDALLKTSQSLASVAEGGNKSRLVNELFGKSLKELAPLLKDLADKGELVAKVTTEQAEEAEKFNKQLFELQTNAADVTRALSIGIITSLNELTQAFKDGEAAGKGFLEIVNSRYWENVAKVYGDAGDSADSYRKRLAEIDQQLSGGESRLLVRNALLREQAELQAKLAATPVKAAADQTSAEDSRLGRYKRNITLPDKPASVAKASKVVDLSKQQEAALAGLADQLRSASGEMNEFDRVVERVTTGTWSKFNDATKAAALAIAGEIDDTKALMEQQKAVESVLTKAASAWESYIEALRTEVEALAQSNEAQARQIEEIGLTTDQLGALKLARMDETIAQKEAALATAAANGLSYEEIAALEQKIELLKKQRELTAQSQVAQAAADSKKDAEAASKEFSDTMRNDLKGAFSAAFRDSSGDPLKAFGDALENMMFTRAATALSEAAMEGLGSIIGSLGGSSGAGIGDLIGNLLSFDGGGSTGSGPRSGGLDGKGGFLSILHPNETVLDHTKGQTGTGGGISIVQNINVDSRSDVATIRAAMQQAKAETLAVIQQSRRAGGAYA